MKKTIIILSTIALAFNGYAQDDLNLVANPSFENVPKKVSSLGKIEKAIDWFPGNAMKTDLFVSNQDGEPMGTPNNTYGTENANDGENYAGLLIYSYNNKEKRTYITSELSKKMEKGALYCVKFYVSLADNSKYASNNIGAHFTKKSISTDVKEDLVLTKKDEKDKVVMHHSNKVFNERFNWFPVCGIYKANGGELHITIGNFFNNKDTKNERLKKLPSARSAQVPKAYYYIDNISVIPVEDESDCKCKEAVNEEEVHVIYSKNVGGKDGLSDEDIVKNSTIYFDYLKDKLEENAKSDLDDIVKVLEKNPSAKLNIIAHSEKNEEKKAETDFMFEGLAKARANKVIEYLKSKGISESRLSKDVQNADSPASFGEAPLDYAKNRRVEFVLSK